MPGTDVSSPRPGFSGAPSWCPRFERCLLSRTEAVSASSVGETDFSREPVKEVPECLLSVQFSRPESRTDLCVPFRCSFRSMALGGVLKRAERAHGKRGHWTGVFM